MYFRYLVYPALFCFLTACASAPRPVYNVVETNRPDGTYGGWTTFEQKDPFNSYTFSKASGEAVRGADFGDSDPKIIVQDDFAISIYSGDGYICSGQYRSLYLDYKLTKPGLPDDVGRSLWRLADSNDHFEMMTSYDQWRTHAWLHALNTYDRMYLQYTDECGEQKVLDFNISGNHHTKTTIISSASTNVESQETVADRLVNAGLIKIDQ